MLRQYITNVQADTTFLLRVDQQGREDLLNIEYRILAGSLSRSKDFEVVLDDIFKPGKDSASRAMLYKSIGAAVQAGALDAAVQKSLDTRLLAVIDQLSNFIVAVQSDDEAVALLDLTKVLLGRESDVFRGRFEKCAPRVCTAALSLVSGGSSRRYGFLVLQCVLSSAHRSCCQHSFNAIRSCSFDHLSCPESFDVAADCVALAVISDSSDNWIGHWKSCTLTCISLVQGMGIAQNIPLPKGGKLLWGSEYTSLSGSSKAMYSERLLRGCCSVMQRMLFRGCATGPVCTELNGLFACCQAVLAVHLDSAASGGSRALVENDSGVSMVDTALVFGNMKILFLEFVRAVVAITAPATLFPVAGYICRSVVSAVSSRDMATSPRFCFAVLRSVADVISSFPTAIIKTGTFTDSVVNLFKTEVRELCSIPTGEVAGLWKAELIFDLIKKLLLFCGAALSAEQRNSIEYGIAVGLSCLVRGVSSSSCAVMDRKVRRTGSVDRSGVGVGSASGRLIEPIRCSLECQLSLLQLATAEVLCPRSAGTISGNISLLKMVAEGFSTHVSSESRCEARKTLAVVDNILHPSAIALPAVPMAALIKRHLAERDMGREESHGIAIAGDNDLKGSDIALHQDLYSANIDRGGVVFDPAGIEKTVAANSITAETVRKLPSEKDVIKAPFKSTSGVVLGNNGNPPSAEGKSNSEIRGVKRSRTVATLSKHVDSDSDDDMELPEIVDDA